MVYDVWHVDIGILQARVSGIPLILGPGTRLCDPHVCVTFWALNLVLDVDFIGLWVLMKQPGLPLYPSVQTYIHMDFAQEYLQTLYFRPSRSLCLCLCVP